MLEDLSKVINLFNKYKPNFVVHLAAQAGARYSIENPSSYIQSNIIGTFNLLEALKEFEVKHFLMASTSSVYGANEKLPFTENDKTDHPISIYAATKKSTETLSHSYSYTFNIPTTIFRFFTVYGPWGRPDMALFKFTKSILEKKEIQVFNNGNMHRDFTYIDDLVNSIKILINKIPKTQNSEKNNSFLSDSLSRVAPWRVINIGNSQPVNLIQFIEIIEKELGIKANKKLMGMQVGDVKRTESNISLLKSITKQYPKTNVKKGVKEFVSWYKQFYKLD